MKLTALETQVLTSLRDHEEGDGCVYLPNAIPESISKHQFAGVLSSLKQKGLYKPHNGFFGFVTIEEAA
jgi:hypothetical protein